MAVVYAQDDTAGQALYDQFVANRTPGNFRAFADGLSSHIFDFLLVQKTEDQSMDHMLLMLELGLNFHTEKRYVQNGSLLRF